MKKIIFLLFFNFLFALTNKQLYIANKIFEKAKKFNLGYTMVAIAKVESNLGSYYIRIEPTGVVSCGTFHIVAKTLEKNTWKKSLICQRLIEDLDFSIAIALQRFKYFYNYWRSKGYSKRISWYRAVCSYNAGFNWKKGISYYKKVVKEIKKFQRILK